MKAKAGVNTEHLLDVIHLNRSLNRKISKTDFSDTIFPVKNKNQLNYLKNRLGDDLAYRIRAEIKAAQNKYGDDVESISKTVLTAICSIDSCYAGDHEYCKKSSLVCSSKRSYKFPYLPFICKGRVKFSNSDMKKIVDVVSHRTKIKTLKSSRFNTTSQKVECLFSAMKQCNPKHSCTFTKNAVHRDHSSIHISNCGPGVSLAKKLEATSVPLSISSRSPSIKALHQMQTRRNLDRLRNKCSSSRRRRQNSRRHQLYSVHKDLKGLSTYSNCNIDHTYIKTEQVARDVIQM